ncbi:unnamed protein product [Adineta ricciae]|uniref:Uncharacterized protein n=1 Tax=Adineta ricciae TaxID=249248 RepID=A0A813S4V4_ADIRI|nr:unnamed protein product [Adineta ricciae]CAF1526321.1 unnamed protein product [Adineta ricciae]
MSQIEIFAYTFLGIFLEMNNVVGLLGAALGVSPHFLLIIFALSAIASNIRHIYSFSLASRTISLTLEQIPRIFYAVMAILAAYNFNAALMAFLDMFSCFCLISVVVICEEHLIFRRCSYQNYDFNLWNHRKVLSMMSSELCEGHISNVDQI